MLVRCSLCGGENEREPGQEMLACSYCGAALALAKPAGPEHLILVHARKDEAAEAALRSLLIEKERRRPAAVTIDFRYVPYAMIESPDGKASVAAAARAGELLGGVPYPPAGEYRYFEEPRASGEKIAAVEAIPDGAVRIVHLPVYTIRYEAGDWKGQAAVVGESWQVIAGDLPPGKRRAPNVGVLIAAAALFTGYLFIGTIATNTLARLALIMGASGAGYALFGLRERVSRRV
jgi:hypothetical protein